MGNPKTYSEGADFSAAYTAENIEGRAPFYVSAQAAANPYRAYQWYLDGEANGESNGAGANIDAISREPGTHFSFDAMLRMADMGTQS
jgi:hypothetical protein